MYFIHMKSLKFIYDPTSHVLYTFPPAWPPEEGVEYSNIVYVR